MEAIHRACRLGDIQQITAALQVSPSSLNSADPQLGWTPLYRCIVCGHEAAVQFLLTQGADPNLQNQIGEGALHQAAESASRTVVKLLLEAKANPNLQQNDGETPLHRACRRGDFGIVKLLLDFGAEVDVKNKTFGWTPLHYCAESRAMDVWDLLVSRGASEASEDKAAPGLSLSSRSTQISALKSSSEDESFVLTPRTHSSSGDQSRPRSRKGSPPLVPRLKLTTKLPENKVPELSFSFRDAGGKRVKLERWLRRCGLEVLTDVLIESGYDDLDQLVAQAKRMPLKLEELQRIGIQRKGHALRLLATLELEAKGDRQLTVGGWECCEVPDSAAGISTLPSLSSWLQSLGLGHLYPEFLKAGYEDVEGLVQIMRSSYAFTETSLADDIEVLKPGHRHRILGKLREECGALSPRPDSASCEFCHLM